MIKWLLLFFLLSVDLCYTQVAYFDSLYVTLNNHEYCSSIIIFNNGYIFSNAVISSDNIGYIDLEFHYIDSTGKKQWKKVFGRPGYSYYNNIPGSLYKIDNNYFLLTGTVTVDSVTNGIYLIKFNVNGDTIWTKKYDYYPEDLGYQVRQTKDKGFILVGGAYISGTNYDFLAIKTDSLGNPEWYRRYGGAGIEIGYSVEQTKDGGYIFGGFTKLFALPDQKADYIVKTDSLGNVEWSKKFDSSCGANIILTADGGYLWGSCYTEYEDNVNNKFNRGKVVKLDSNGTLVWERMYGDALFNSALFYPRVTFDGGFIFSGLTTDTLGYPQGWLLKINADGDSLWGRSYERLTGPNSFNYLFDVQPTQDNGYIASGFTIPVGQEVTTTADNWVIKTDSLGCLVEGCDTIVGIEQVVTDGYTFDIFPNPAFSSSTILLSYAYPFHTSEIVICDILGNVVQRYYLAYGQNKLDIHSSLLQAGIYFVIWQIDGRLIETRKLVILQ